MMNRTHRAPKRTREAGFSIVTAIFLVVVLAALGAFIASVSTMQQKTLSLDVQGERAYQAVYAGVQWAAYQLLKTSIPTPSDCFATTNLTGLAQSLAAFTVTVTCSATPPGGSATEGKPGRMIRTYSVTATACNEPSGGSCPSPAPTGNYIERQLLATLHKCLDQDVDPPYSCG